MATSKSGRSGFKEFGDDGSAVTVWWVFPSSMTDEAIFADMARSGADPAGYYGGPGQPFAHDAYVARRQGQRVLVLQDAGRDI